MKHLLSLLLIFSVCVITTAQVEQVNYKLDYDPETKLYDVKVVFAAGEFDESNPSSYIAGNAQVSFVIKADTFEIIENVNPIAQTSGAPMSWEISTQVLPQSTGNEFTYYSITPVFEISSYPLNTQIGDELALFRLKVTSVDSCETSLRLWDNILDTDPPTGDNFNQSFTMAASLSQLYSSNVISNFCNANLTCFDETTILAESSTIDNPTIVSIEFSDNCIEQTLSSSNYKTYISHKLDITDPEATILHIEQGDYTFDPDFSIYEGEDCSPKTLVSSIADQDGNVYHYSSEDGDISNFHNIKINTNPQTGEPYSYWLAVGSNEELPNEDFEIFIASVYLSNNTIGIVGPDEICKGSTTQLSPNTGGMWTSSDLVVASATNEGMVTGISAGEAIFYYSDINGLIDSTGKVTVLPTPVTAIITTDIICIEDQTAVTPSVGGTWLGGNIATSTDAGIVTGVTLGTQDLYFTDNNGCVSDPLFITVTSQINAKIGQSYLCIGESTTISFNPLDPIGSWESSNTDVVTVADDGTVVAINGGVAYVSYVEENTFCRAEIFVRVFAEQVLGVLVDNELCKGETALLQQNSTAEWTSTDNDIATIDENGLITAVSAGTVELYGTAEDYCPSEPVLVIVNPKPDVSIDVNELCIGELTQALPATLGTWLSSDFDIASITNGGLVTALSPGQASLVFTDTNGCQSEPILVTVLPPASVSVPKDVILIGETIQATGNGLNGERVSSDPNIATVDDNIITGVSLGTVQIFFFAPSNCPGVVTITVIDEMLSLKDQMIACNGDSSVFFGGGLGTFLNGEGTGTWSFISGPNTANIFDANNPRSRVSEIDIPGEYMFLWTTTTHVYETSIFVGDDCDCDVRTNFIFPPFKDTYCLDDNISLESITPTPQQDFALWEISMDTDFSNPTIISDSEYLSFIPSDYNLEVGKYYLRRQWTGTDGCFGYSNCLTLFFVSEETTPPILGEPNFCQLETISLQVEGSPGCSYNWTGPNGFTFTGESINIEDATVVNQGIYTVQADCGADCQGNIKEFELVMSIIEPPIVSSDSLCIDEIGMISQPDGSIAIYTSSDILVASVFQGNITPHNPGIVAFIAADGNGCESQPTQVIVHDCGDDQPCDGLNPFDIDIIGNVFTDSNGNGVQDNIEGSLSNIMVTILELDMSTITDDNGYFDFANLEAGTYTLIAQSNIGEWIESEIILADVIVDGECTTETNFGFVPSTSTSADIQVVNTRRTRCDETVRFYVDFGNTGSDLLSGTVSMTFDDMTEYSVINNTGMLNGNTISWEFTNLEPHDYKRVQFYLDMPAAESLPLPDLVFIGQFRDLDGNLLADDILTREIRCSFDPNDKTVNPDRPGDENYLLADEELEYTIRFQNNGNDTAYLVNVIDTLDVNIDPRTLRIVDTSHPMTTSLFGREVTFTFEDILLVDSMTNYDESQGYVSYICKAYPGLEEFVTIENRADIIFDTNPPIVTNTVLNTYVDDLCFNAVESSEMVAICDGDAYEGYTVSGVYIIELTTSEGCDSLHRIELTVESTEVFAENHSLCAGESVEINGIVYSEDGIYADTLYSSINCPEKIFNIHVEVREAELSEQEFTICPWTTVLFNEVYLSWYISRYNI